MRVTPDYVVDLFALCTNGKERGVWDGEPKPVTTSQGVGWQITFLYPDNRVPLVAHPGYWIVAAQDLDIEVLTGPAAVLRYSANVDWDWDAATSIAPVYAAHDDGTWTLMFRQPASLNGPLTYVIERSETVSGNTAPVTVIGEPLTTDVDDGNGLVLGANIAIMFSTELVEEITYGFKVTATDAYGKTATSLLSDSVTG